MKRPVGLIIGAAAAAMLIAAIGASAHSGFSLLKLAGVQTAVSGDEASGARTEPTDTPEATNTPEAPPTAEPTDKPEAADTETDTDTETNDDTKATTAPSTSGEHDDGGDNKQSGGGESGD